MSEKNADQLNLDAVFEDLPFDVLGGFEVTPDDQVPHDTTKFAVLIGNIGSGMFDAFAKDCDPLTINLDCWTEAKLAPIAKDLNAAIYYPFTKPALPFQRWARRANAGFASPLGLNIHPDWGLWHGYRALLAFDEKVSVKSPVLGPSPCEACADQPCLSACPVNAFDGTSYDVASCGKHLMKTASKPCHNDGCLARLACPVGAEHRYNKDQMQFHMTAFANSIWSNL